MPITTQEWEEILQRLKSNDPTLTSLNLSNKKIGPEKAQELAAALEYNNTLTFLNLVGNAIESKGAKAFATLLKKNNTLEHLDLRWNYIGLDGVMELATSLQNNNSLSAIYLDGNSETKLAEIKAFETSLQNNTAMTFLNLDPGAEDFPQKKTINKFCHRNENLESGIIKKIWQKYENPTQELPLSSHEIKFISNPKNSLKILAKTFESRNFSDQFRDSLAQNLSAGVRTLVTSAMAPERLKTSLTKRVIDALIPIGLKDFFRMHGVTNGLHNSKKSSLEMLPTDALKVILEFLKIDDIDHKKISSNDSATSTNTKEEELRKTSSIKTTSCSSLTPVRQSSPRDFNN